MRKRVIRIIEILAKDEDEMYRLLNTEHVINLPFDGQICILSPAEMEQVLEDE